MKPLMDLPRDETGRLVYGNPTKGCRFCGYVAEKVSEDGKVILYHPGTECCEDALKQTISNREGEITLKKRQAQQHLDELDRLEETVRVYGENRSTAAAEARLRLEKARAGVAPRVAALRAEVDELALEVADLRRRLGRMS